MEFNAKNINNLTGLWKEMGTQSDSINCLYVSAGWPNRCWFDWETNAETIVAMPKYFSHLDQGFIVPVWDEQISPVFEAILMDSGFEFSFQQTAMYLNLENYNEPHHNHVIVSVVSIEQEIEVWTNIATQSFEYEIDVSVIKQIADVANVQLLLTYVDTQPVATAILYKTGDIIGVHQFGVIKEYRSRGIARRLMQYIIKQCKQQGNTYIMLQASEAGEHLYRNLGFKPQFTIQNFQKM